MRNQSCLVALAIGVALPAIAAPIDIVCQGQQITRPAGSVSHQPPSSAQIDLDQRRLTTDFGNFAIGEFDDKRIAIRDARVEGLARLSVEGSLDRLSGRLRLVWRNSLHSGETVGEYSCSKASQKF